MSEDQLTALLAKLKDDAGLREKLKCAADLDAVVTIANDAGFGVSKADLLKHQPDQKVELNDDELERLAGGVNTAFGLIALGAALGISAQATCALFADKGGSCPLQSPADIWNNK